MGGGGGSLYFFSTILRLFLNVRRNESLLFITIFEVINVNNYKTTKYCPSEMMKCRCRKKSFEGVSRNSDRFSMILLKVLYLDTFSKMTDLFLNILPFYAVANLLR